MGYVTFFFFFNDTATTEIYTLSDTLSLHDALPICSPPGVDLASAGDQVVDELERVVQPARVGAAALGQVGPPATPAAYGPGDLLHEPSRLDALDEIRRHCGDEVHLAVDDAPDADDAGAETVAQRVGDRAEAVGVEAVEPPRDHVDAVDLPRRSDQLLRAGARQLDLERRQLLLEHPL